MECEDSNEDPRNGDDGSEEMDSRNPSRHDTRSMEKVADTLLLKLFTKSLVNKINLPVAEALLKYPMTSMTIHSSNKFNAELLNFYRHLGHCQNGGLNKGDSNSLALKALALAEKALTARGSDLKDACAKVLQGGRCVIWPVLETMAGQFAEEWQESYVREVLETHFQPLDWEDKVELIHIIVSRLGPGSTGACATN